MRLEVAPRVQHRRVRARRAVAAAQLAERELALVHLRRGGERRGACERRTARAIGATWKRGAFMERNQAQPGCSSCSVDAGASSCSLGGSAGGGKADILRRRLRW